MTLAQESTRQDRFPSPFEVAPPPGGDGWDDMYPYYLRFSDDRRAYEDGKLWFFDSMHWPNPVYPFDIITAEATQIALSEFNTRVFAVPPAIGIDHRVLNGYLYLSPEPVRDEEEIGRRLGEFKVRAGYYYENWDRLYEQWREKVTAHIKALRGISIPELPEGLEPPETVTNAVGISTGALLLQAYNDLINSFFRIWSYHCELLNLGYVAYLTFFQTCQELFPSIPDGTVAKMVAGIEVLLFRPDDELRRLAQQAVDAGIAEEFLGDRDPEDVVATLRSSDAGREWLASFDQAKDPWFYFSSGTGIGGHAERSWIDDLSAPMTSLRGYVERLREGEDIARPTSQLRERREQLASEYRKLLSSDQDRATFDELLGLARMVFPYIEDHNFYVEHWYHTIFWNKIREIGRELERADFLAEAEDVFMLSRHELGEAVYDLVASWATGTPARGPHYWPAKIARRNEIFAALGEWRPHPALGPAPEVVTDAFQIMLWGITTERVRQWLQTELGDDDEIRGIPASAGVAEGPARVVRGADELKELQPGEVLVCPITAPSWVPVIVGRIVAAVSDIGGTMSHAAIISREYGLPAVVGTATGTERIKTGQRVRVDGDAGTVRILD